jgi:hypothetical protein
MGENEGDALEDLEGATHGTSRKARPDRAVSAEGEAGGFAVAL